MCPTCGKKSRDWRGRGPTYWQGLGLNHCSRACYLESRKLDAQQIERIARQGLTRSAAAKVLDISYPQFTRKLRQQGLNELFPGRGKWSRYMA